MLPTTLRICGLALVSAALSLGLSSCSDSVDQKPARKAVQAPKEEPSKNSPKLGDGCTVEVGYSLEEINTREGSVSCSEAQRIVRLYVDNVDTREPFPVGPKWTCTSAPGGMKPYMGSCTSDSTIFESYLVGWAREPSNINQKCLLEPVDGAGFLNLRATDIPCGAAKSVIDEWASESCPPEGPCRISNGLSCDFTETGYESGTIICEGRGQKVSFDTAA
jgi:hypothetical protein